MNVIEMLGILYKEDIISNFLAGLINESKIFRISFLEKIVGISKAESYDVKAFTRIATSQGTPDIIIRICNDEENILAIIENKLKAEEGYEQTARYSKEECVKDLCLDSRINLEYESVCRKYIYLTLIPEQIPTGEKFINKIYRDLLAEANVEIENEFLNKIYDDFLVLLEEFYRGIDVSYEDNLGKLFYDNVDSEKIYIRFKNLMKLVKFDNDLKVAGIGKTGGTGRIGFAAKIAEDNWTSNDKLQMIDEVYKFNGDIYDIHLEFSFDPLNKIIKLPLHYETNPYIPKNKLIKYSAEEDYHKYISKRELFKETLHKKIDDLSNVNIRSYNGSN